MILIDSQIKDRIDNHIKYEKVYIGRESKPLIENFKEKNLQAVAYDVTMTDRIKKFKNEFRTIDLTIKDDVELSMEEDIIQEFYILKPNEYILVQLNEYINMPDDLVAHIRPRTSFTRLGLIVSFQHINPSYEGKLQIGLLNANPNSIKIQPGTVIGQVVFETISGNIEKENLYYFKKTSKYNKENDFVPSRIYEEFDKDIQIQYLNFLQNIRKE